MDVPIMEMDKEEAKAKVAEYADALKRSYGESATGKRQKELDRSALAGFKAFAAGKRVINVHAALSYAGTFTDLGKNFGLPRIAIARADASMVHYSLERNSVASFRSSFPQSPWGSNFKNSDYFFLGLIWNFDHARKPFATGTWRYSAIVPTIPPGVRPRYAHMRNHVILWEADWQRAPADPMLLRPIGGDLYTVEAEWDLTELERMLLEKAAVRP